MTAASTSLVQWVGRMIADLTGDGPITRFELLHTVEGEPGLRVHVWHVPDDDKPVPEDFATEVMHVADTDAQSWPSGAQQRYVLCAFRAKSTEHDSLHAFIVRPARGQRFGDESDPPNEKGAIAYALRHGEGVHRLLLGGAEAIMGPLIRENERLHEQNGKFQERSLRMIEIEQQLLDRNAEREVEKARQLNSSKRLDELMGVAIAMAPLLLKLAIEKMGGKPAELPVPSSRDLEVKQFFKNLSPVEWNLILGALQGQNVLVFAEVAKAFDTDDDSPMAVTARMLALRKFMKNLATEEAMAIFNSLSDGSKARLQRLYVQLREEEEREDSQKPEPIRG